MLYLNWVHSAICRHSIRSKHCRDMMTPQEMGCECDRRMGRDTLCTAPGDLDILCLRWVIWNNSSCTYTIRFERIAPTPCLIAIHKPDAIFWERGQHHLQFRRIAFQGAKILQLGGTDVGENTDSGANDAAQIAHFAGMVATEFHHGVFVTLLQTSQRERYTQQIVIVLPAFERRKTVRQH